MPTVWRDGLLSPFDDADRANETVWSGLEEDDAWEGLLAIRGDLSARICSVPVFAYDLHLGDEVQLVLSAENAPVITAVLRPSGNWTFRARLEGEECDDPWLGLLHDLKDFDCVFDVYSPRLVAVSASASGASAVSGLLASRESAGELAYETGATTA